MYLHVWWLNIFIYHKPCAIDTRDRSSSLSACIKTYDAIALTSYSLTVLSDHVSSTLSGSTNLLVMAWPFYFWFKEEGHLNFPNRKVESIKLGWTIYSSIGHTYVVSIMISKNKNHSLLVNWLSRALVLIPIEITKRCVDRWCANLMRDFKT